VLLVASATRKVASLHEDTFWHTASLDGDAGVVWYVATPSQTVTGEHAPCEALK
jgi:hypothetical protein